MGKIAFHQIQLFFSPFAPLNETFREAKLPDGEESPLKAEAVVRTGATRVDAQTRPELYRHWKLQVEGAVARLTMDVKEDGGLSTDYALKLNSYDLSVDIELADAVTRLRFEHPEVSVVVITSGKEKVFCAGANIFMLAGSTHPFKVNFCKFTNETRVAMEEASEESGQFYLAALNGVTSGGGYELALACKEIHLIDDRASTVSLPEIPFLGVLPGTGGLTRLVDKRHVRRDHADIFSGGTQRPGRRSPHRRRACTDDVGMLELSDQFDLTFEPSSGRLRCIRAFQQDLDGNLTLGALLAGLIDDALSTAMNLADDVVALDGRASGTDTLAP